MRNQEIETLSFLRKQESTKHKQLSFLRKQESTDKLLISIAAFLLVLVFPDIAKAATGETIPHGGYSATTDSCLQCHDIHEAGGDYVLFRWRTVTDTCSSCHYLYQTNPGGLVGNPSNPRLGGYADRSPGTGYDSAIAPAYEPGYAGSEAPPVGNGVSVGSPYSAYEVPFSQAGGAPGHQLQRGPGNWGFNDGAEDNANYVPGGTKPLTALEITGNGYDPENPATVPTLSYGATGGLYCASCHTPHGNYGQQLKKPDGSPTSAKLLSSRPNHSLTAGVADNWYVEGGEQFCGGCHDKRLDQPPYHNHPDKFCLTCHANPSGDLLNPSNVGDFPHTGPNDNLLAAEPDAICITCHVSGKLP